MASDRFFRQIAKWTAIGLLLRVALMFTAMHGQDLVFIHYFPSVCIREGTWDPYGLIRTSFPAFPSTYYGPVFYFIMIIAQAMTRLFSDPSSLIEILKISATMMFGDSTTADYARAFAGKGLYKNLFLMKLPYLAFDLLMAAIILRMARAKDTALASYKLWMLNIVVLHSTYAVGQFDIVPAFFVLAAALAAVRKRPYLCMVLLGLGGGTKLFPYLLIGPAAFLLGDTWRKRCALSLAAAAAAILPYVPFMLSSGNAIFGSLILGRYYSGPARWALPAICACLYILILIYAAKDSVRGEPAKSIIFYFLAVGFLTYAVTPISFRYFVFITPLLALVIPGNKRFGLFMLFVILLLAFVRLPDRDLQMGLFAPIDPGRFAGIPALQEIIGKVVPINALYSIAAKALLFSFFGAVAWIWAIKIKSEERHIWPTI
ncbi:MAG: glycosyltransferase 87 family protein [Candidatus Omnitrophota bacterium]